MCLLGASTRVSRKGALFYYSERDGVYRPFCYAGVVLQQKI